MLKKNHLLEEQEKSSYIYAQAYLYVKISYSGINCGEFSLMPVLLGTENG